MHDHFEKLFNFPEFIRGLISVEGILYMCYSGIGRHCCFLCLIFVIIIWQYCCLLLNQSGLDSLKLVILVKMWSKIVYSLLPLLHVPEVLAKGRKEEFREWTCCIYFDEGIENSFLCENHVHKIQTLIMLWNCLINAYISQSIILTDHKKYCISTAVCKLRLIVIILLSLVPQICSYFLV